MDFKLGAVDGVVVKELAAHIDDRGWLTELYRNDEIADDFLPAMCYISGTKPGVTRGPHEHSNQADYFCFLGPSTFRLYCWDSRKDSPTYGNKLILEVGEEFRCSVIVPPGVVHAYKNIGETIGWVINLPNKLYAGSGRSEPVDEIRYENNPESPYILE